MSDVTQATIPAPATPSDVDKSAATPGTGDGGPVGKPRSLWSDAWHDLRRNPLFVASAVLITLLLTMSVFPGLFTSASPRRGDLANHFLQAPQLTHFFSPEWLGYDAQGRSIYARVIHGARASVTVGVAVTLLVTFFGGLIGMLAGYFGGWIDSILSRILDTFAGIPFLLGAMVVLNVFDVRTVWIVALALAFLGWTQIARVTRGSVITTKQSDYVQAAKALGAGTGRILTRHVLPNAIAPVIVVATIALGGYIAAEASLSFLGIGISPPTVSWGMDVSDGKDQLRNAPHVLLIPAVMVSVTVLAFIMLGDAVRNALDPKLR
ncbi:ABC transporter permease [Streptomyces sp. WAC 00631]|uniref:ABC transporter permease n=1 Tax=unclassified Streptomyces TaxID=2593676 RepID=UPI000F7AF923|nr:MULTISPECIES: ABC transporter permease [unclassified Streptomyces]MCC5035346.1 ABC transporter permease [Streptomyces sp. WAC 00631]MCC9739598.1 ABC transporter permease [Streptomyces sp. MNU89]